MSIALFTGLGALGQAIGQNYNQQRDQAMRSLLLNAQLVQQGGQRTPDASAPIPGAVNPMNDLGSQGQVLADLQKQVNAPPPTPGPAAGDGVPTDSGSVLQNLRAANAAQPAPTPPSVGNDVLGAATPAGGGDVRAHLLPPVAVAPAAGPGASAFAAAARGMAPTTVPSGTPTPGTAPTGADLFGPDSPLMALVNRYQAAIPHGTVDVGQGWQMDLSRTSQALEAERGLLGVLSNAALEQARFKNAQALETQREGFEGAQQVRTQAFEGGQTDKEIAAAAARQKVDTTLRLAEMEKQARQFEIMTGFRQTQQAVKAMDDITKPLQPIEQQAATIRTALRELDAARTNPSATAAASISAAMAQVAAASPRLNEGLAGLAGRAMDPSAAGTWQRFFSTATGGTVPSAQIDNAQAALRAELAEVDQNWQKVAIAGATGHPELGDGLSRIQSRHAALFPESAGMGGAGGAGGAGAIDPANVVGKTVTSGGRTMTIGPKTAAAAANPNDPNHAAAVALLAGAR